MNSNESLEILYDAGIDLGIFVFAVELLSIGNASESAVASIDGGNAGSVYAPGQVIDGGGA